MPGVANINFNSAVVTLAASGTMQQVGVPPTLDVPGSEGSQVASAIVKALAGNSGKIYVGPKNITANWLLTNGYELVAGDSVSVDALGLGNLYFDGGHTGDGICILTVGP
jgi:hypothetical protein